MAQLYSGTSGFAYPSWKPRFYPAGMPDKKFLEHYASRLNCVEINYTFRRLPAATTLENWVKATPASFRFACKANMRITHILRLKDVGSALDLFLRSIDPLRSARRLGPILFQLPPNFSADEHRLRCFLKLLSKKRRYSFEFRHPSWYAPAILRLLSAHDISLCLSDHHDAPAPWRRTADFVYVRGHGPGGRYHGNYTRPTLTQWAKRINSWKRQGCDVFVYFDNDQKSAAPADALKLKALL